MASAKEKPFWIDVHEVCANVITARPVGAGRAKKVTEVALISQPEPPARTRRTAQKPACEKENGSLFVPFLSIPPVAPRP